MNAEACNVRPEFLYSLGSPNFWGDYGAVLIGGDIYEDPEQEDLSVIERTGPFVPPIAEGYGGGYAVTEELRLQLERSSLVGASFRPLTKKRIVKLDWHTWERTCPLEAWQLPKNGDPESYLLEKEHDPRTAAAMPPIWELLAPRMCEFVSMRTSDGHIDFQCEPLISWSSSRIGSYDFIGCRSPRILVSARAKQWLEASAPDWVAFERIRVVD